MTAEVTVLAIWGYLTPGAIIPTEQAVLVLGGTALLVALVSVASYKLIFRNLPKGTAAPLGGGSSSSSPSSPAAPYATRSFDTASLWTAGSFVVVLTLGSFGISGSIGSAVGLIMQGYSFGLLSSMAVAFGELGVALLGAIYLLYRLDLGTGLIKRRVRAFEVGWKE
jgi:hypothetical protein